MQKLIPRLTEGKVHFAQRRQQAIGSGQGVQWGIHTQSIVVMAVKVAGKNVEL